MAQSLEAPLDCMLKYPQDILNSKLLSGVFRAWMLETMHFGIEQKSLYEWVWIRHVAWSALSAAVKYKNKPTVCPLLSFQRIHQTPSGSFPHHFSCSYHPKPFSTPPCTLWDILPQLPTCNLCLTLYLLTLLDFQSQPNDLPFFLSAPYLPNTSSSLLLSNEVCSTHHSLSPGDTLKNSSFFSN